MSFYKVTVVNRTDNQVWVGIDPNRFDGGRYIYGNLANGVLNPGVASGFTISGSLGPYEVGFMTVLSGQNQFGSAHTGIIVYDVRPGAIVTVTAEAQRLPSAEADKDRS